MLRSQNRILPDPVQNISTKPQNPVQTITDSISNVEDTVCIVCLARPTRTCETNSCSAATGGVRIIPSALAAIHSGLVSCSSASDRQDTTVPENNSYSYFVYESATNLLPS